MQSQYPTLTIDCTALNLSIQSHKWLMCCSKGTRIVTSQTVRLEPQSLQRLGKLLKMAYSNFNCLHQTPKLM